MLISCTPTQEKHEIDYTSYVNPFIGTDFTGNTYPGTQVNPEKPDVPLNKNDAFQKVQKRRVQEKR